jgi:hypothetical protein
MKQEKLWVIRAINHDTGVVYYRAHAGRVRPSWYREPIVTQPKFYTHGAATRLLTYFANRTVSDFEITMTEYAK